MSVPLWIAEAAKAKKLNKYDDEDIAQAIGFSIQYIRSLLQGRRKNPVAISKICDFLRIQHPEDEEARSA